MPYRSICRGHTAPFQFIVDAFFELVDKALVQAPRSGGKTQSFGLIAFLEQLFKGLLPFLKSGRRQPIEILNIGAVEEQALKCFDYTDSLWRQDEFNGYMSPTGALKQSIVLPDGSKLRVTVATLSGVNSPHVPRVHIDEVDLWKWYILQQAFSISQSSGLHKSITRLASTQKYSLGNIQKLKDEAGRRGFKFYKWCIYEVLERCPEERICKECSIYEWPYGEAGYLCGGRAKLSTGYYRIDDFIQKVDELDRETLETEWLCLRPSRSGLVLGADYVEELHRVNFRIGYTAELPIELSLDQGWSNPFGVLFIQDDKEHDQTRIIAELYETHSLPEDIAKLTADKLWSWRVSTDRKLDIVYDMEDPSAATAFVKHLTTSDGKHRYYARLKKPRGKADVMDWLKLCRRRLKIRKGKPPRIVMSSVLKWLPWELTQYHYPESRLSDRAEAEKPVDKDNHLISAWYRWEAWKRGKPLLKTGKDVR